MKKGLFKKATSMIFAIILMVAAIMPTEVYAKDNSEVEPLYITEDTKTISFVFDGSTSMYGNAVKAVRIRINGYADTTYKCVVTLPSGGTYEKIIYGNNTEQVIWGSVFSYTGTFYINIYPWTGTSGKTITATCKLTR